jgi:PGF-pre-PGF domain-containing protein
MGPSSTEMVRISMKLRCVIHIAFLLLVLGPAYAAAAPATPAGHTVTFLNTCNQPVWINLQGGPKGVCDGIIDPNTHQLKKCSACSLCEGGGLCNTSEATGDSKPLCCPGIRQDLNYCWNKENQCNAGQCCPGIAQTANTGYNCPGVNETTGCQNTTMTQAQIDALSGYNNPKNELSRIVCNGSLISNGGFKLDASTGSRTFTFEHGWQGGFYPRTNCTFDNGIGNCETGNCKDTTGKGLLECGGAGSTAPVTKGEFNLDDSIDWYDVSWVDGFNIAMVIQPVNHDPSYTTSDPSHHCATAGCSVGLHDFSSPAVPDWSVLKYPDTSNFTGILSDCNLYSRYKDADSTLSDDILHGYCCPIAEGYVNNSAISCNGVPDGKLCKTCAGQDNTLYPFNLPDALPNSAKLFYHTCPTAYAYTYNDTDALMTCQGTSTITTSYTITLSCPAPPASAPLLTAPPAQFGSSDSSSEEPTSSAVLSPGGSGSEPLTFIFNDFTRSGGSSATSDTAIHHIHVNTTGSTGETILRVTKNPDLGTVPGLAGHAFAIYYRIESPHLQSSQVGSALVEFSVREKTLTSLGLKPEDVVLMHWDGTRWIELPTVFEYSSNGRAYYSATTPGFSYFAITSRGASQVSAIGTTLPLTVLPSMTTASGIVTTGPVSRDAMPVTLPVTAREPPRSQENQSPVSPPAGTMPGIPVLAAVVIIVGCCIIGGGWYARRWWMRRQNPVLFENMN